MKSTLYVVGLVLTAILLVPGLSWSGTQEEARGNTVTKAGQDTCVRGTWKQEGKTVFVCPNPGNGAWGGAATHEEIARPQHWQKFEGKKVFLKTGDTRYYKTGKTFVTCENDTVSPPNGWKIRHDMQRSKYRLMTKELGMVFCK